MADLIEYIRWRGDLTFSERPFNDVDNLVLSQIAYHAFDGIIPSPGQGQISLQEAADLFLEHPERGAIPGQDQSQNNRFLKEAAACPRFGQVLVSDFVNDISDYCNNRMQFSALCYHLPDDSHYCAFRGTDDTVVGWREDFMFSYEITNAQKEAAFYLASRVTENPDALWRVGGHSKGGTLAVYAATNLVADLQDRIDSVYSNDGPGIPEEFSNREGQARIQKRIHKFTPTYGMIGMLLEDPDTIRYPAKAQEEGSLTIVKSSARDIVQHWALSWQVEGDHFQTALDQQPRVKHLNRVFDRWIRSASFEERQAFIRTLFDSMNEVGSNVSDLLKSPIQVGNIVLGHMRDADSLTQSAIRKFFDSLGHENQRQLLEGLQQTQKNLLKRLGITGGDNNLSDQQKSD